MTLQATVIQASFPDAHFVRQGSSSPKPVVKLDRPLSIIGSGKAVHICVPSRTVSAAHAMILNADGRILVRDLASHTHVYVNGRLVREAVLKEGDEVRMGRLTCKIVFGDAPDAPSEEPTRAARLWDENGQPISIEGPTFVIGRRRDADLVVPQCVAPAAVVIFSICGGHFIRHLGFGEPLRVNDNEVQQAQLTKGDRIEICGIKYQYDWAEGGPLGQTEGAVELLSGGEESLPGDEMILASTVIDVSPPSLESAPLDRMPVPMEEAALETGQKNGDNTQASLEEPIVAGSQSDIEPIGTEADAPPIASINVATERQAAPAAPIGEEPNHIVPVHSETPQKITLTSPAESEPPHAADQQPKHLDATSADSIPPTVSEPPSSQNDQPPPAIVLAPPPVPEAPAQARPIAAAAVQPPAKPAPSIRSTKPVEAAAKPKSIKPAMARSQPSVAKPAKAPKSPPPPVPQPDYLNCVKDWGPLAIALAAQHRPELLKAAEPPPATPPPVKPRRRRWGLISAAAIIAIVLGLGTWLGMHGGL